MKKIMLFLLAFALIVTLTPTAAFAVTTANAVNVNAPVSLKAAAKTKTSINLTWTKVNSVNGYQIYRKSGKSFKKIGIAKTASFISKKLKKDIVYTFKVRAYKKSGSKTYYSKFTYTVKAKPVRTSSQKTQNVKSINLGLSNTILSKGKTKQLKVTYTPSQKLVSKVITWSSSDTSIAAVSGSGLITAKKSANAPSPPEHTTVTRPNLKYVSSLMTPPLRM